MDGETRAAAIAFVGVLGGFKLLIALTIFLMQPSGPSAGFLIVLHGYWLLTPLLLLGLPTLFWLRLLRARARRKALIREEWLLSSGAAQEWKPTTTRGTM